MTPLHHHFEMTGWKEPKIVFQVFDRAVFFAFVEFVDVEIAGDWSLVFGLCL
jgi:phospho-N-acetylmuramoyl-pentapeptide-transferase